MLSSSANLPANTASDLPADFDPLAELPELTEEEDQRVVYAARRMARIEKANRIAREESIRKLNETVPVPTAEEYWTWLLNETKTPGSPRYLGPNGYVFNDYNKNIFWALCLYVTGDARFEQLPEHVEQFRDKSFSLTKSISLFGPVGCGKTELLRLFSDNPTRPWAFVRCRQVQSLYENTDDGMGGEAAIRQFIGPAPVVSLWRHRLGGWGFDDLGTEDVPAYHFKKAKNVMQWVLEEGYNANVNTDRHLTLNLSKEQIVNTYGGRVQDRLKQTLNLFIFPKEAPFFRG